MYGAQVGYMIEQFELSLGVFQLYQLNDGGKYIHDTDIEFIKVNSTWICNHV